MALFQSISTWPKLGCPREKNWKELQWTLYSKRITIFSTMMSAKPFYAASKSWIDMLFQFQVCFRLRRSTDFEDHRNLLRTRLARTNMSGDDDIALSCRWRKDPSSKKWSRDDTVRLSALLEILAVTRTTKKSAYKLQKAAHQTKLLNTDKQPTWCRLEKMERKW